MATFSGRTKVESLPSMNRSAGVYGTRSEYMRELIRGDQDRQRLRGLLLEGAASRPADPADEAYFQALRERARKFER